MKIYSIEVYTSIMNANDVKKVVRPLENKRVDFIDNSIVYSEAFCPNVLM